MWYVEDKTADVLLSSAPTRARAYEDRKYLAFLHPDRKFRVMRIF